MRTGAFQVENIWGRVTYQSTHCGYTLRKVSAQAHFITSMNAPGLKMICKASHHQYSACSHSTHVQARISLAQSAKQSPYPRRRTRNRTHHREVLQHRGSLRAPIDFSKVLLAFRARRRLFREHRLAPIVLPPLSANIAREPQRPRRDLGEAIHRLGGRLEGRRERREDRSGPEREDGDEESGVASHV